MSLKNCHHIDEIVLIKIFHDAIGYNFKPIFNAISSFKLSAPVLVEMQLVLRQTCELI
jgi:hypothetical protein